uniref:Uncharacterized protein n=1 Tax=Romanomermis culicivorax TaxID=13658 RepID=A0A915KV57_ROMCU
MAADAACVLDNLMEGLYCKGYTCKPSNFKIANFAGYHTAGFKISLEEISEKTKQEAAIGGRRWTEARPPATPREWPQKPYLKRNKA